MRAASENTYRSCAADVYLDTVQADHDEVGPPCTSGNATVAAGPPATYDTSAPFPADPAVSMPTHAPATAAAALALTRDGHRPVVALKPAASYHATTPVAHDPGSWALMTGTASSAAAHAARLHIRCGAWIACT